MVRSSILGLAFVYATAAAASAATNPPVVMHRAPLAANHFYALPLGAVKPSGWLKDQLQIQADGLSGHLQDFWPDLSDNSAWLGGKGEGWERGPYYVDGLVPLAYLLNDSKLIQKARRWIEWTLNNQRPDGGMGPEKNLDWWPNMIMIKALTQYQEVSGDSRVVPFLQKYVAYQLKHIRERPLYEWAAYRWQDEVLSLIWLYDRTGDNNCLELARVLHEQGYDWKGQFSHFGYTDKVAKSNANLKTHGVNNAMALKASAVWSVISGSDEDRKAAYQMLQELDRYHGQANGMHSGDEHYAGLNPSQGVELCAVVEAMFSYETEIGILGDPKLANRLEKVAFNALPGTFDPDMWAHQYDQQPNQVLASLSQRDWATNGPESNLFGLEPNFGCCTANMHQGWPKFAASLWMATPDGGFAAIAYSPSVVTTELTNGTKVRITEDTQYPFRNQIKISLDLSSPANFPLELRVPEWAEAGSHITVNGTVESAVKAGTFHTISRTWRKGDVIEIQFPFTIRVQQGYHNSAVIERGPLVYSLAIGEAWHKLKQTAAASDWEVFPTSPWNYALKLDWDHPASSFRVQERPVPRQPFSFDGAPVVLSGTGKRLPEWQLQNDSAGQLPVSPVESKNPEDVVRLIPYGAAKLRVTNFPWLSSGKPAIATASLQ
jgi:uncharacterized protein